MKNVIITLSLMLGLTACAGHTPVSANQAQSIDDNRVLAYQSPQPNHVKVDIFRKSQFMGGGCYVGIMYEETLIARIGSGEKATVYLPAGSALFSVVTDPQGNGLCGKQGTSEAMRKIRIDADKANVIEVGFRGALYPYIQSVE